MIFFLLLIAIIIIFLMGLCLAHLSDQASYMTRDVKEAIKYLKEVKGDVDTENKARVQESITKIMVFKKLYTTLHSLADECDKVVRIYFKE